MGGCIRFEWCLHEPFWLTVTSGHKSHNGMHSASGDHKLQNTKLSLESALKGLTHQ